jgi:hypothetical protein
MGILDRLMFWKDDQASVNDEYGVAGCFTLPDDPAAENSSLPSPTDDCAPAVDSIDQHRRDTIDPIDGEGDLFAEALEDSTGQIDAQLQGQNDDFTDMLGGTDAG